MTQLVVDGVCKSYPSGDRPLTVLERVQLRLGGGQNLAIVGPSGSGKSTLLQIIGTLDPPTAGHVLLDQVDPFQLSEPELAAFRNSHIGFIFQDHHLLPQLNVVENVLLPALALGRVTDQQRARADQLVERVGLGQRRQHRPGQLSGGERGRVAVARALLLSPKLILADEPTGNLDARSAQTVTDLLVELPQQENAMLIVVTHSQQLAERMQQTQVLVDGRLQPAAPRTAAAAEPNSTGAD
jgi:lipoprotein-releasing system ATP-binding protein